MTAADLSASGLTDIGDDTEWTDEAHEREVLLREERRRLDHGDDWDRLEEEDR